jgi:hypothetical protein
VPAPEPSLASPVIRDVICVVIRCVMQKRTMALARSRPDFAAHTRAVRATFPEVVGALRELLGAQLVAYLGSVRETRAVRQWADGTREPSDAVQQRLRVALQVATMLSEAESPQIAQAWMQGLNPQLDDRSAARLVREGDIQEVGPAVIGAARVFLVSG